VGVETRCRGRFRYSDLKEASPGDIRTTMNIYGAVVTDEMKVANSKVAQFALAAGATAGEVV
jgi:hypothetical protein